MAFCVIFSWLFELGYQYHFHSCVERLVSEVKLAFLKVICRWKFGFGSLAFFCHCLLSLAVNFRSCDYLTEQRAFVDANFKTQSDDDLCYIVVTRCVELMGLKPNPSLGPYLPSVL